VTRDPLFWGLIAAFAAILSGIVIAFDPRFIPSGRPLRMSIGLVAGGVAAVIAITGAEVLL